MSHTLKDMMQIYPLSLATLVAGERGLSRPVTSANIQEVPEVYEWVKEGEIVFTSGFLFSKEKNLGINTLRKLRKKKTCALVIKTGKYMKEVPNDMIQYANKYDFPILKLPSDIPYMDCIIPIFENLMDQQLWILKESEMVQHRMLNTMLDGGDLDSLCSILRESCHFDFYIFTPRKLLIGSSVRKRHISTEDFQDFISTKVLNRNFQMNICNTVMIRKDLHLVVIPISVRNGIHALLAADITGLSFSERSRFIMEDAAPLIMLGIMKEEETLNAARSLKSELLNDLLAGRYTNPDMILRRALYAGIDLNKRYCIAIMGIHRFQQAYQSGSFTSEMHVQEFKEDVLSRVQASLSQLETDSILTMNGLDIICLIQCPKENTSENLKKCFSSLITDLSKDFDSLRFTTGISRLKIGIKNIHAAWNEADHAQKAEYRLSRSGNGCAIFSELGTLCLLTELPDSEAIENFLDELIRPLEKYDAENSAALIETLGMYFRNGQNLRKTSEALYVHKNTIIYRLEKIESLLQKKINNPDTSFAIQLALKIRDLNG